MKRLILIVGWIFFLAGCATAPKAPPREIKQDEAVHEKMRSAMEELQARQKRVREELQQGRPAPVAAEPIMPVYDPLEDYTISFAMVDEPIHTILYALAKSVGMNLILDPDIKKDERRLTLNFENVSAAKVLREVLGTYDLYYETRDHVIRVAPFQEKIFQLNFLNADVNTDFTVGGDVLGGGGGSNSVSGLAGNFRLSGRSSGKSNAYDVIEDNVKALMSSGGKFTLNRLSGSLYVKDSPASLRAIGRMINRAKEMADRQILIEARIVEVALTDAYRYGIDWSALREEAAGFVQISQAGWNLGQGLVLSHQGRPDSWCYSVYRRRWAHLPHDQSHQKRRGPRKPGTAERGKRR
ncbi:MAG: hypothetical protein P8X55_06860 [Desulfosarcinaceae bacterium]